MRSPCLWIALTRPDNLLNALAAVAAVRERFAGCRLLYEDSGWWRKLDWRDYQGAFDETHPVRKVPTCRGLADLPRFYRALRDRQRFLKQLSIQQGDTLLLLAGITALSNALASAYPAVHKILCIPVKKYVDASVGYSFRHHRHTTSGWLQNRVLEPRLGLYRTLHLKPWRGGGDGVRIKRLAEPLETVFNQVLLLSNTGDEVPPGAGTNVRPARFPSLRDLQALLPLAKPAEAGRKKVLFFGTPFLLVRNLPPEEYARRLNACLEFLRRHYADSCELVYRPHPAETGESSRLQLAGYRVEDDGEVAEMYFLRHFRQIEAVFSVSSTVSRVALNYGLHGYSLWRCFPFPAASAAYFESLMGQVPPGFDIGSLDEAPRPYAVQEQAKPGAAFAEAFQAVCQLDSARTCPASHQT